MMAVLALVAGLGARTQSAADKSIFVSVVDASGKPVKDLTMNEFQIREDNVQREVVGIKPATQPLAIQLLLDTSENAGGATGMATGADIARDMRASLVGFVKHVSANSPESQMAIMEFGQAAIQVVNYTSKAEDLEKGINRLMPKPKAASVLHEALIEASKSLGRQKTPRRAIVVLNVEPGEEQSQTQPNDILNAVRASGASLWVVHVQRSEGRNSARDLVLGRLTQFTGGRRESIVGQSAIENYLKAYADALMFQYELTFKRPESRNAAQQTLVGITRPGLRLHASAFAPK
jgi:VWFA-related protein